MKRPFRMKLFFLSLLVVTFVSTGAYAQSTEAGDELLDKPKAYVGSKKCRECHLTQYYSWRTTMHSRMSQDVRFNKDAIIEGFNKQLVPLQTTHGEKNVKVVEGSDCFLVSIQTIVVGWVYNSVL